MTQRWRCIFCRTRGSVRFAKDAGVFEVVEAIVASHRKRSPGCTASREEVQAVGGPR